MNPVLAHAFAHRDDEHPRPLFDALDAGFRHIELDVWYLFGRLLVAHDLRDLRPRRTFRRLYLEPLVAAYRDGRLAPDERVWIYLDVKSRARPAHRAIERIARAQGSRIARPGTPRSGAPASGARGPSAPIHLVLTGNRPPVDELRAARDGFCHYDGRLSDLAGARDARWMPVVSDDWSRFSRWRGEGAMPEADLARLRAAVRATSAAGQRLRFWATPDRPGAQRERVWSTLLGEGVDLLNTDDLAGLAAFLRARQRGVPASSSSSA